MSPHLSDLALDALTPHAERDLSEPHLGGCDRCRARLTAFRAARERALAAPEFERVFARVAARRPTRRDRIFIGLAIAAALALAFVAVPHRPAQRLKGGARLQLVRLGDARPASVFHPGEQVALSVGGAGHRYALVVARPEASPPVQVWPSQPQSGEIGRGAAVQLQPAFEVTEGSMRLVALFSDAPLDGAEVLARWKRAGEGKLPEVPGEAARAQAELRVEAH